MEFAPGKPNGLALARMGRAKRNGLAAGGKIQPQPDAAHALEVIFNPKSTETDILAEMKYLVANPADSAKIWAIFKISLDPGGGGN